MSKVDDELTRRLRRAERPVDGDGLFEGLERRRARRESLRKAQTGFLALAVLAATVGSFLALSLAFRQTPDGAAISPFPILPKENGLLAYADGSWLYTVPASDGGDISRIPGIPNGAWLPAWSPDGTKLAVAVFPRQGPREIWIVNADGSNARKLAEADNVSQPDWSPDGSMIVYAADTGEGSAIHVIKADGTDDRKVGEVIERRDYFSAAFSPDGTKLLFDTGTDAGFGIFLMNADGTNAERLSQGDSDYNPKWSPSGLQIVFTRQDEGPDSDIFVMDADGSSVRRLTDGPPGDTNLYATFSPDGTKIAYVSGKSGGPGGLVVMEADGRDPRTIVEDGVLGIAWQPLPGSSEPSTTREPEASVSPQPSVSAEEEGLDIGLGFNVCNLERLGGIDFLGDGTRGQAWTGAEVKDNGTCPEPSLGLTYLVVADVDGDGVADASSQTVEFCFFCRPFGAVDFDADGDDELVVMASEGSTPTFMVYDVRGTDGAYQIEPVLVAEPGHREARAEPGQPLTFSTGGDEGYAGWVRCEDFPAAPVLVITWRDHPIEGDTMEVHETRFVLEDDGMFHVVGSNDYSTAVGEPIPGVSDEPACGVDWQILD
jgi:dipeptidyl aminopeptidase/acylaminoacyl peptidase